MAEAIIDGTGVTGSSMKVTENNEAVVTGSTTVTNTVNVATSGLSSSRAYHQTDAVYNSDTSLTPKFSKIQAASSGDNIIIGGVSSKKIRVLSLFAIAGSVADTVELSFTSDSGASPSFLTGSSIEIVQSAGFSLPYNPVGWFETGSSLALNMKLNKTVPVNGAVTYVEV